MTVCPNFPVSLVNIKCEESLGLASYFFLQSAINSDIIVNDHCFERVPRMEWQPGFTFLASWYLKAQNTWPILVKASCTQKYQIMQLQPVNKTTFGYGMETILKCRRRTISFTSSCTVLSNTLITYSTFMHVFRTWFLLKLFNC